MTRNSILSHCILLILFYSCSRSPVKGPKGALKRVHNDHLIDDDLDVNSFTQGVEQIIGILNKKPNYQLQFGTKKIDSKKYAKSLEALTVCIKKQSKLLKKNKLIHLLSNYFNQYIVYGRDQYGEILLTSYYEPLLEGRKTLSGNFSYPLYALPDDLIEISWNKFDKEVFPDDKLPKRNSLSGRLIKIDNGLQKVVPYFSRKEIDKENALQNKNLELVYVDPIEGFFLQIQGSGSIRMDNKNILRLGYAGQNGHPYVPIGKFLKDIIPKEKMSLQSIEKYLRQLKEEDLINFLNKNPSYVFFRKLETRPITTIGAEVVAGRSLAVDNSLFPLGSIGMLKFPHPLFKNENQQLTEEFETRKRLIFATDTGGAIKGADRADLFWGTGSKAKKHAGLMRHKAKLIFFAPIDHFDREFKCL